MSGIPQLDHLKIPLEHIKLATDNFSSHNFIGRGGFGNVYIGQLSISGKPTTTVAVKRLDDKSEQGEREFSTEIVMLASYKHRNLASLIGFSDEGGEKIIVYKHEVRGSLDNYLAAMDLTWVQRLRICLGAACGLNYLHSGVGEGHRVLHRDIKSSNILLDENWEAKVSDFGLSKIGPTNQVYTFLVTNACGTFGYLDPVYFWTGVLTKESDVYSFGVVLFEVLCGRLAMIKEDDDERAFLSPLVKRRYEVGKLDEIIIPDLRQQMKIKSLETFSRIAYQCLKEDRKQRPTMEVIVQQLQMALAFQIGTGLWGSSTGGSPWSFQLERNQKLRKITIDYRYWIYSLIFTTEDINGSLHTSERYGGFNGPSGGQISEIKFDADEEIIGISGTVTQESPGHIVVISSLCFETNKRKHGPFGMERVTRFSETWDMGLFDGFYGRAGWYLDALGCYLHPKK